ncbi:MAG: hypothetical protein IPM14_04520 [bacterium]|nr:hypothetical protein [bacterium]
MKKIIIYITIASLLNLVGCYYQQQMSPNDYDFSENNPIKIIKNDSTVYVSNPYEYQLRGDTLFVIMKQTLDNNNEKEKWIGFPLNDIQLIETDRIDSGNTILLVSVITIGIIAIAAIIYAIALENATYGPIFGK